MKITMLNQDHQQDNLDAMVMINIDRLSIYTAETTFRITMRPDAYPKHTLSSENPYDVILR